ncbi:hypothetical protein [Lacrimispora brassicae]
MDRPNENFTVFLKTVDDRYKDFVMETNDYLTKNKCKCEIKTAKSGFITSYKMDTTKKVLATFVSRKTGMRLRIYPEHLKAYEIFLNTLPDKMKKEIKDASVCKRLINPEECNPKCVMGYDFFLDGEHYQKCRYMAFMPALSEKNNPYIKTFLENELNHNNPI